MLNRRLTLSYFNPGACGRACLFLLTVFMLIASYTGSARSAQINLQWDSNSESNLAGYKIHYGLQSQSYTYTCDVGNLTVCDISDLQPGSTYYFAATAYNTDGLESDFSTEIFYLVPESGTTSDPGTDPVDSDQDGISDTDELTLYGTDPDNPDTDADGISDADELNFWNDIWNADNDSDGIINLLDPTPDETPATTAQLTLAWDTNSETDLAGYKIHYGLQSRTYDTTCDVGNFTSCTIADLTPGTTYYFAATAYNTDGLESNFSTEVAYLVPESGISSDPETDPVDSDQDGISDTDELTLYGTDPGNPDTDADGISDIDELNFWNDTWNADNDSDGIINLLDPAPDETPATTAQLTLAWDTNSETDLAGYKIHYGLQSRTYDTTCDVGNFTSCTIADLTPGTTYYFTATAYNTEGLESDFSTEVSYLVP